LFAAGCQPCCFCGLLVMMSGDVTVTHVGPLGLLTTAATSSALFP
jgi:hypothetical protein